MKTYTTLKYDQATNIDKSNSFYYEQLVKNYGKKDADFVFKTRTNFFRPPFIRTAAKKQYHKKYYQEHKDIWKVRNHLRYIEKTPKNLKILQQTKEWNKANREKVLLSQQKYREKNKKKIHIADALYRLKNREKLHLKAVLHNELKKIQRSQKNPKSFLPFKTPKREIVVV